MRALPILRFALGVLAVPFLWWAAVTAFAIHPLIVPHPLAVLAAFRVNADYLLYQTLVTVWHTFSGLSVAIAAAACTAFVLTIAPGLADFTMPYLLALNAVPKVVLMPVLIAACGFGDTPKIILVALLAYVPLVISMMTALTSTPRDLLEVTGALGASRWQTYVKLRIPQSLPQILSALRIGALLALIGAVVAQLLLQNAGLGAVVARSGQFGDTPLRFAAILLLALIGITLHYALSALERWLVPWARATTG